MSSELVRSSAMILVWPKIWMSAPLALAFWMMLRRRAWKEKGRPRRAAAA